jgi:hypothetical protein
LKKMGIEKAGGVYLIDDATMEILRSRRGKRGRPKCSQGKAKADE